MRLIDPLPEATIFYHVNSPKQQYMKQAIFLFSFLFLSTFWVRAQSSDEKAIRQILDEVAAANKSGNMSVFERVYTKDFVFIDDAGKKYNKAERIAYNKTRNLESFSFSKDQIRMYGNTAVVNTEVNLKPKGQPARVYTVTIVMVKKDGHWQEVNGQSSPKS